MGKLIMKQEENTERKIVEAALQVFQTKGYEGARMRDIAETAKINKGLLHYYFKTKDKLFEKAFGIAFQQIITRISTIANSDASLFDKIRLFTDSYIDILSRNSYLPRFVINEINRNPDLFIEKIKIRQTLPNIHNFLTQIEEEIAAGNIREIEPKQLVLNLISMCIFPFLARPMVQVVLEMDNMAYKKLIEHRKNDVAEFIINAIRIA